MKAPRPCRAVLGLLLLWGCGDGPATPSRNLDIQPASPPELYPGDDVQLTLGDPAPATWQVRDPSVASVSSGLVEALRPGATWIVAAADGARDSVRITVAPRPGGYTADEVDYFAEIAPGFEFGNASRIIRKWGESVRLRVNGSPSQSDLDALDGVVAEINALTATHDIVLVDEDPLVEMHFAPTSSFPDILPGWVPGNVGYFSLWWGSAQTFTRGVILISTDIEASVRPHLIREELTQSLGLANDSHRYANSIFYQEWSTVTEYAPVDRAVIEILYRPEITVGMAPAEAARTARRLVRAGAQTAPQAAVAEERCGVEAAPGQGAGGHTTRAHTTGRHIAGGHIRGPG